MNGTGGVLGGEHLGQRATVAFAHHDDDLALSRLVLGEPAVESDQPLSFPVGHGPQNRRGRFRRPFPCRRSLIRATPRPSLRAACAPERTPFYIERPNPGTRRTCSCPSPRCRTPRSTRDRSSRAIYARRTACPKSPKNRSRTPCIANADRLLGDNRSRSCNRSPDTPACRSACWPTQARETFSAPWSDIRITLPMLSDRAAANRRKCWDMGASPKRTFNTNTLGEIAMPVKRRWRFLHDRWRGVFFDPRSSLQKPSTPLRRLWRQ